MGQRDGYLWLKGFISKEEVRRMRTAMDEMIEAWELPVRGESGKSAIQASLALRSNSTLDEVDHSFMLESATKASIFVELGAVDADAGTLRSGVTKKYAVRKVAHALHLSPGPFMEFSTSSKVSSVASALGLRQPAIAQSLYRL